MNHSDIRTVVLKELKDISRDNLYVAFILLGAILTYPATLIAFVDIYSMHAKSDKAHITHVTLAGDSQLVRKALKESQSIALGEVPMSDDISTLTRGSADILIEVPKGFDQQIADGKQPRIVAVYNEMKNFFPDKARVDAALDHLQEVMREQRLIKFGVSEAATKEMRFKVVDGSTASQRSDELLAWTFPMALIAIIAVATLSPALDLITAERERCSLEPLLVSAVSRRDLVFGKLCSLIVVGSIACFLAIVSTVCIIDLLPANIRNFSGSFILSVSPIEAALCLPVLLPIVILLSASALSMAAYARNFQQGIAYATPYILITLFLSATALVPLAHLPFAVYFVPVANAAVCIRAFFTHEFSWAGFITTLLTSTACAWLMSRLAVDLLSREETLFYVQVAPKRRRDFGYPIAALFVVSFLLMFYTGQLTTLISVVGGIVFIQICVVLLPSLGLLKWLRQPFRETLSWNKPSLKMLIGAPLLAPGLVLLGGGLEYLQNFILPTPQIFEKMFTDMIIPKGQPLWITLLTVAALPGFCEEIMFRGVILGLLRKKWPAVRSCAIVAVMFGFFHLSGFRLVPTAILGFILGLLVVRSKSIFPSMLLHAFNNGISVLIVALSLKVESPPIIIAAVASTLLGAWLILSPQTMPKKS